MAPVAAAGIAIWPWDVDLELGILQGVGQVAVELFKPPPGVTGAWYTVAGWPISLVAGWFALWRG
jgi:hypothetical protein